ncbi:MAG: sugar phosphate nucleotidyltransferase [Ignavibacteriales bacterium]|nr:sugar phosphate nucleotidyltransferase [Ignavibacteriales bacterium]
MKRGDTRVVILAGGVSSRMKSPSAEGRLDPELVKQAEEGTKGMISVGEGGRPFIDYQLYNMKKAGIDDVVIVVGEKDEVLRQYYGLKDRDNEFHGLRITYAIQRIPEGRSKPMGTVDALFQALLVRSDWKRGDFIVCNSDNLYSVRVFTMLLDCDAPNALIDYDRSGLEFAETRIAQFGITKKDKDGYLLEIVEKPPLEELERLRGADGTLRVSMNIFRLNYEMIFNPLRDCPESPVRHEKELVTAVTAMVKLYPRSLKALPLKEHVPDLTYKDDIAVTSQYLREHYPTLDW